MNWYSKQSDKVDKYQYLKVVLLISIKIPSLFNSPAYDLDAYSFVCSISVNWPRLVSIRCIGIEPYSFTKDYHASFNRQNFQLRIVVFAVHKLDRVCQIGTHDHEKGKL